MAQNKREGLKEGILLSLVYLTPSPGFPPSSLKLIPFDFLWRTGTDHLTRNIDHSDSSNRKRLETIFFPEGYPMKNSPGGGLVLPLKKWLWKFLGYSGPPEMAFAFTFQRIGCKKVNVSWYLALELVPLRSEKKSSHTYKTVLRAPHRISSQNLRRAIPSYGSSLPPPRNSAKALVKVHKFLGVS